jgi:hypothetical protein
VGAKRNIIELLRMAEKCRSKFKSDFMGVRVREKGWNGFVDLTERENDSLWMLRWSCWGAEKFFEG